MSKHSTIVGFAAIILMMTAGAAQSLAGTNTVDSGDIIDGTITHADVKANSLGGSRFLDNSVTSGKILDTTILTQDIRDGEVSGDDIKDDGVGMADVNFVEYSTKSITLPSIPGHICTETNIFSSGVSITFGDDVVTVTPPSTWNNGLVVYTQNVQTGNVFNGTSAVQLIVCNITADPIDPPDNQIFDVIRYP